MDSLESILLPSGSRLLSESSLDDLGSSSSHLPQTPTRGEKLQNDLFVLRKLNGTFRLYNEALSETESGTERVAVQLEQTNALLDKYVDILAASEKVTRLMFDERWGGGEADETIIENEELQKREKRRQEEERQAILARQEQERKELVEQERLKEQTKEQSDRQKKGKLESKSTSGVRGVRGTRASIAARGVSRAGAAAGSSRTRGTGHHNGGTGVSRIAKPSSLSARGSEPRSF